MNTTVLGFIANVEYNLTYKNEERNPIEAAFTFPLDEQSAIYRFEAEVEGRLIVGECQGKEEVIKSLLHSPFDCTITCSLI